MMFYIKLYLIAVPIFFAIDMFWLGFLARGFYRSQLAAFLSPQVNWTAAIVFYLIYIAGILYFAVIPALEEKSLVRALISGALFGFFTYATYDLTNMATLENWPLPVVIVDILWGTALCGLVATSTFWIARWQGI